MASKTVVKLSLPIAAMVYLLYLLNESYDILCAARVDALQDIPHAADVNRLTLTADQALL